MWSATCRREATSTVRARAASKPCFLAILQPPSPLTSCWSVHALVCLDERVRVLFSHAHTACDAESSISCPGLREW
eukprot:613733-Rhodomonas_salina.1